MQKPPRVLLRGGGSCSASATAARHLAPATFGDSLFASVPAVSSGTSGTSAGGGSAARPSRYAEWGYVRVQEVHRQAWPPATTQQLVQIIVGPDTRSGVGNRLPLGRAIHKPGVGSLACPTLELAASGYYNKHARRQVCTVAHRSRSKPGLVAVRKLGCGAGTPAVGRLCGSLGRPGPGTSDSASRAHAHLSRGMGTTRRRARRRGQKPK